MVEVEVVRSFSIASGSYEDNARAQCACAQELVGLIGDLRPASAIDVGCGTGFLARLLREKFPDAKIDACDPSQEMLAEAARVCSDDCISFKCCGIDGVCGSYSLIASNAAIHWAGDPNISILKLKCALSPGGTLAFSYFTHNTYRELAQAISDAVGREIRLPSDSFASADEIETILNAHFVSVLLKRKMFKTTYHDLRTLLEHIRLTGTRGGGIEPRIAWTRSLLADVERAYIARFGEVASSAEVAICVAR